MPWLLFIGKTVLGFAEKEVWDMEPVKLLALFEQYCIFHGYQKREASIDDIIPEGI